MSRKFFRVVRKWTEPKIEINLSAEAISLTIEMGEFADALCAEIGSPALLMSKAALREKVGEALQVVMDEMKSTTKGISA